VKVVNAFISIFSIFVFLTMGSFLMIVSFHLISQEEVLRAVTEVYAEPLRSLQTALIGVLFIVIGLTFSKIFLKNTKGEDAIVFQGENGTITVTAKAIDDVVRKVIRKFSAVKEIKIKTVIQDRSLSLKIKLVVWSGVLIPEIIQEVQLEVKQRLGRMLGLSERIEIQVDIAKVILSKEPKAEVA